MKYERKKRGLSTKLLLSVWATLFLGALYSLYELEKSREEVKSLKVEKSEVIEKAQKVEDLELELYEANREIRKLRSQLDPTDYKKLLLLEVVGVARSGKIIVKQEDGSVRESYQLFGTELKAENHEIPIKKIRDLLIGEGVDSRFYHYALVGDQVVLYSLTGINYNLVLLDKNLYLTDCSVRKVENFRRYIKEMCQ